MYSKIENTKKIPVIFHNGSVYDYHFIIKELTKESDAQFKCLSKNTEKYTTFSVSIKKQLDNGKTIAYKLKFIESFRFISTSLSSLVNNLSDELYNAKCTNCKSCLEYISAKDSQLIFKCPKCNSNHNKDFNKELINRFASTYESKKIICSYALYDYMHSKKVFKIFKNKNIGDYHDFMALIFCFMRIFVF